MKERTDTLRRLLLLLPAATVLIFGGLTALTLIERDRERPPPGDLAPAPAAVLARYERESRRLGEIRESGRGETTPETLAGALTGEKPEELPPSEKLIADLRSLSGREPGAAARLLPTLLEVVAAPAVGDGAEARIERAEALLTHIAYAGGELGELPAAARERLLAALEAAVSRGSRAAAPLLLLVARAGEWRDAERLLALGRRAPSAQIAHEIEKVIAALEERAGICEEEE